MKSVLTYIIPLFAFVINVQAYQLLLFGGDDYRQFLGEFTGNPCASDSVWNDVGRYGSDVSSNSIWNEVGTYGSEVSTYSPFNCVASNPPKIVDGFGNFYGYLTINAGYPDRATFPLAMAIYDLHPLIRKDRYKWATKLNTYAVAPIKRTRGFVNPHAPPHPSSLPAISHTPAPLPPIKHRVHSLIPRQEDIRPPELEMLFGQRFGALVVESNGDKRNGSIWFPVQPMGERMGMSDFSIAINSLSLKIHTVQGIALTSDWGKALSLYNNVVKWISRNHNISRDSEKKYQRKLGIVRKISYEFDHNTWLYVYITRLKRSNCTLPIAYDPFKNSKTVYEVAVIGTQCPQNYP
jgi:hypothetical protein